ncbi:MAG: hypothetical protein QM757_22265 [Paludibaculum sp.]
MFGLKVARGKYPADASLQAATSEIGSLVTLLEVYLRSVRRREDLLLCVENIAAGNVRLAIELVRSFFGSGHVDTQKIVNIAGESGYYTIPVHEFQRAITYGDNIHFDPSRSPIANLLDVSGLDLKEHFLQSILLDLLQKPSTSRTAEGFFPVPFVYENLQRLRFTPEQIDFGLVRLFKKRLIETSARRIPEPGSSDNYSIRITSSGLYHLNELLSSFTYYDAVVVDTPILGKQYRERIRDAHSLDERLQRASVFVDYLDMCWNEMNEGCALNWSEKTIKVRALIEKLFIRQVMQKRQPAASGETE